MKTLEEWIEENGFDKNLIWAPAGESQISRFVELGRKLNLTPLVAGAHSSKSCSLPVILFDYKGNSIYLRDNYYDVNVAFRLKESCYLSLDVFYPKFTWEQYLDDMESKRGYCWKGWTDAEIHDERITRVKVRHEGRDTFYWSEKSPGEKERWLNRFKDPAWHGKDWGDDIFWEHEFDEFGPNASLYVVYRAFQEGIGEAAFNSNYKVFSPYQKGLKEFVAATHWKSAFKPDYIGPSAESIIEKVLESLDK